MLASRSRYPRRAEARAAGSAVLLAGIVAGAALLALYWVALVPIYIGVEEHWR